jgi:acyl-CoA thioesterase-2
VRHDAVVTYRPPSLTDVIATLLVDQIDDGRFVATQLDNPSHHIVGGHIAGQALMAASRTAPGRIPHSVHVYYLRAGDASRSVDIHVEKARDGGTLSTRQVTARQDGEILLEALASFTVPVDGFAYQEPMADVPDPEALPPVQELLTPYADEYDGRWTMPSAFDLRYVDAPPRLALDTPTQSPRIRLWWRPTEPVPDDPVLGSCLLTYQTGTMMLETAMVMRQATPQSVFNALIDHALWFHRPVDFTDWVLSDQTSPSGFGGRGLATGTIHNRAGELVCIATQELYFGRK